ncbi:hypothetical protein HBI81_257140 [Parastagonospora nodorum]|nr:hypothetical protein HBI73_237850 [Parastagonospora nodorum]KAH5621118.1 hypothetical protein HBI23_241190 [Parastagonospora nodorum]KAH6510754.1 hypothetical protein HBI81_257140 [Parastagonospora nodorum]
MLNTFGMSGLQGSRWASNDKSESNKSQDGKNIGENPKDKSRHLSIPYFGFVLPPFMPKNCPVGPSELAPTRSLRSAAASTLKETAMAPTKTNTPAPEAVNMPATTTKVIGIVGAPSQTTETEKQLTPAELAAAKTRARMAEIMGPRHPQGTASGARGKSAVAPDKGEEKKCGDSEKEMPEPRGDVEMSLMD